MMFKEISDKALFLKENYPFEPVPALDSKRYCLHCGEVITVGEYKVQIIKGGDELIVCPNAPRCDGNPLDWWTLEEAADLMKNKN